MTLPPPENDWDQQPGESFAAYTAFRTFVEMEPSKRSIYATWRALNPTKPERAERKPPRHYERFSKKWEWRARAIQYDNHIRNLEESDARKKLQAEIMDLELNRIRLRKRQVALGHALMDRAEKLLELPHQRVVTQDGSTIIEPANWSQDTMAKLAQAGADLVAAGTADVEDELTRAIRDKNRLSGATPGETLPEDLEATHAIVNRVNDAILAITRQRRVPTLPDSGDGPAVPGSGSAAPADQAGSVS